jgi:hypothetical protein
LANFLSYITSIFLSLKFFSGDSNNAEQQQRNITNTGKTPLLMFQILQVGRFFNYFTVDSNDAVVATAMFKSSLSLSIENFDTARY